MKFEAASCHKINPSVYCFSDVTQIGRYDKA